MLIYINIVIVIFLSIKIIASDFNCKPFNFYDESFYKLYLSVFWYFTSVSVVLQTCLNILNK